MGDERTAVAAAADPEDRFAIQDKVVLNVRATGDVAIMFDWYQGTPPKGKDIPPQQKLYLDTESGVVLPSRNVMSFLGADNPKSCAAIFGKGSRGRYAGIIASHVVVEPDLIPFTRKGKPIIFNGFPKNSKRDLESGIWVCEEAPRVIKVGRLIPQDKKRPVLPTPWALDFTVTLWLIGNDLLDAGTLTNWIVWGGQRIGFGTYRPRYGRFTATVEIVE